MPKTTEEFYGRLPKRGRTSPNIGERDRYEDIGTVAQGPRKEGKEDPDGEYLTKGGHSINATKVIKLLVNENHGKFSLIATQAPKQETINSFLELVFTSKIDAIVVLGKVIPGILTNYWNPDTMCRGIQGYDPLRYSYGPCYKLLSTERTGGPSYRFYNVSVDCYKSGKVVGTKDLDLFHYYKWEDRNVPDNRDDFEKFVKLKKFETARKLLVHCSAGIGRTGTFAACLQAWKDKRKDPFEIVSDLREHRSGMVQTPAQFDYVCKFIARNCTEEGKKNPPEWDDRLDYEKYFGKSESEVKRA